MTMDGYSQTPKEERIKILQSVMPEIFDEGKIDWEKLRAALGEDVNIADERYRLNWAGKSDAFRVMQEPSAGTLIPCREESVNFDNTQNIFIEGENMEVLKVLQKSYFGKVKMIYIDPPYNTGNDSFIYPDRFSESREEYMRRVGDKNDDGYMLRDGMFRKNSKENGQYHSNWLNMMMPRLYLAKSLLREDGVIFVSIDDNEVHNLRLLMNEIFGEENFVACFKWNRVAKAPSLSGTVRTKYEYVLSFYKSIRPYLYGKDSYNTQGPLWHLPNKQALLNFPKKSIRIPQSFKAGNYGGTYQVELLDDMIEQDGLNANPVRIKACSAWGQDKINSYIEEGSTFQIKKSPITMYTDLTKENNFIAPSDLIDYDECGVKRNTDAQDELKKLDIPFDYSKPLSLPQYLIKTVTYNDNKDVIIFDFFAGSGTTAHAVMQLNKEDGGSRKYICVQLPEPCDENSEAGKAGYRTIADIAKERIRRAGAKIRTEIEAEQEKQCGQLDFDNAKQVKMPDLGFKVFKLADSNFKQWRKIRGSETEAWQQQVMEFIDPVAENATVGNMVYELLLKSGKDLNSSIEYKNGSYAVNGRELILMLESATQETVDAVLASRPDKVIALDRLFEGNDQLKTNTVLQMKDAGITFITI